MIVIARAHNGYKQKFGIPRQSGRASSVVTRIVFEPDFRMQEALRGIESFSHLWLIWGFSANSGWSPTVRPPRLGGNRRLGVFATRSPFRPNPVGLSSVRLERVEKTQSEGLVLVVSGADLMDGTPIYDIKPYLPYTDIHTDAVGGFAMNGADYRLQVVIPEILKEKLSEDIIRDLTDILSEDPRPAYKNDGDEEYGLTYSNYNIRFKVQDRKATVIQITKTL